MSSETTKPEKREVQQATVGETDKVKKTTHYKVHLEERRRRGGEEERNILLYHRSISS